MNSTLSTAEVKKINCRKVYRMIYEQGAVSKQQIISELSMGLSTVTQNLKDLEEAGLICREGHFDSTGGRRAKMIRIVPDARIAVGIGVQKEAMHFAAVDLYGSVLCKQTVNEPYEAAERYYARVGELLREFLSTHGIRPERIPGVSIATQGLTSPDGRSMQYGVILGNGQMKLSDFERHIPYPCRLIHDSTAAACWELWHHREVRTGLVLLLNRNFGGAVILDGQVRQGEHMRGGLVEHLCLQRDGPLCYCGKRGCLETFCSAGRLEALAGMPAAEFFTTLPGDLHLQQIWDDYLDKLAFAIRNLSVVIDGDIIISGYLAPFFRSEDIRILTEKVNAEIPFPLSENQIILGTHGQYAPTMGGALHYVQAFLNSVALQ